MAFPSFEGFSSLHVLAEENIAHSRNLKSHANGVHSLHPFVWKVTVTFTCILTELVLDTGQTSPPKDAQFYLCVSFDIFKFWSKSCTATKWLICLFSNVLHSLSVYYQLKSKAIKLILQKWAPTFPCGTAGDYAHSQPLQNEALDV